jgi:hypothetical protein
MNDQPHPAWCDPANCTAYTAGDLEQVHRTEVIVVPSVDGDSGFYIHGNVGPDSSELSIEVAELREPLDTAFYLAEPSPYGFRRELIFSVTEALAITRAIQATQTRIG